MLDTDADRMLATEKNKMGTLHYRHRHREMMKLRIIGSVVDSCFKVGRWDEVSGILRHRSCSDG